MKQTKIIWKCTFCGDEKTSLSSERHKMDVCNCGKSSVDLEEHYMGGTGKIEIIDRYELVGSKWISDESIKLENRNLKPTMKLRYVLKKTEQAFIENSVKVVSMDKVLQQLWINTENEMDSEWIDVEIVNID